MARITNILSGDTGEPTTSTGSWVFINAQVEIFDQNPPVNVEKMLLLRPIEHDEPVVLQLDSYEIPQQYRGDIVDFGFYIKSDSKIVLNISAVNDNALYSFDPPISYVSQTKSVIPSKGAWAFPRVNRISTGTRETPEFVTLTITISEHNGAIIYFARPILVPTFFHLDDEPTEVVISYLPSEWVDIDNHATNVVGGAGKLLHCMNHAYQDVFEIFTQIRNLDHVDSWNDNTTEFASTLTNIENINEEHVRWLAQFMGASLIDPSTGLTPWANLPKIWANWADIDTADVGTTVEWSEIEGYDIEVVGAFDYFKWQVQTGAYAVNGGTLESMRLAAQRVLMGTKTVEVRHHPINDWVITVRSIEEETNPVVLASAVYASKPAGFALEINDPYLS